FGGYRDKLETAFPGQETYLVLDDVDVALPAVRDRVTPLLHSLFARVGYPGGGIHSCIYAGSYRSTPFGVHIDDCHVLMTCGVGVKQMAFWDRAHFEGNDALLIPGSRSNLNIEWKEHLGAASTFEIGPSDVLYWPPGYWHSGTNDAPGFHASLSLGLYQRASLANVFRQNVPLPAATTTNSGLENFDAYDLHRIDLREGGAPPEVPAVFRDYCERVREPLAASQAAERLYVRHALSMITSAGFGARAIATTKKVVPDQDFIGAYDPRSFNFTRIDDDLLFYADGSEHRCAHSSALEAVLRQLRDGTVVHVKELVRALPAAEVDRAVQFLARAGMIRSGG
ncbi:MAG: cupin superfamily protein, partial [Myxococcaceae bacterium]|nr:cupin superfamily protein [Myxococcaceae bacterium]